MTASTPGTASRPPLPSTILGYPRIGPNRELKRALESYWKGNTTAEQLLDATQALRLSDVKHVSSLGLNQPAAIPDTHTLYDQVLDTVALLGAWPTRFANLGGGLDAYFACARGTADQPALEMTKWFDTNYHYLVPEIDESTTFSWHAHDVVEHFNQALAAGITLRPVLVGPVTFLALSKGSVQHPDFDPLDRLEDVVAVYHEILTGLAQAGVPWVQLDEPALISDNLPAPRETLVDLADGVYRDLAAQTQRPNILLALPYGNSVNAQQRLALTGVEGLAVDLVRGTLTTGRLPEELTLAAGVVDGRGIWRTDLAGSVSQLEAARQTGARVVASTTNSLQHVPHSVAEEVWPEPLNTNLHSWLAFADEKVAEIEVLDRGLQGGFDTIAAEVAASTEALAQRAVTPGVVNPEVRARVAALTPADRQRSALDVRVKAQQERLHLPPIPTTTIGSFPQTTELRQARAAHNKGTLSDADYEARLKEEIKSVIKLQEDLGLDVLVHGEPERNDMVQYFAELLDGFDVTANGWVQSYGSRCTRPSILWGDVARTQSLGGEWIEYTQTLTSKPVKGMLTGPVTVIAWSFPRNDLPLGQVADQIGLALRDEIAALEEAGTPVIQVDEPALRELLPLDADRHQEYLDWAVNAFKVATSGVRDDTQIHTHLCYSEFNQIIDAIAGLDADVTSIEAARSRMEVLHSVHQAFKAAVGPGIWDIHSPRVPSEHEEEELLRLALRDVPADRLWANPDCGLKTRAYPETVATIKNFVEAVKQVRASL